MPSFSIRSLDRLETCHPDLRRLFEEVIKHRDCAILEGHRGKEAQEAAFAAGTSDKHWPEGRHNATPSMAVDVAPWLATAPHIPWNDRERLVFFAGFVLGVAARLGIAVRWGGDWDGDLDLNDQHLVDLPHFELV